MRGLTKIKLKNAVTSLLIPSIFLTACGGEEPGDTRRETENSTNLSGLWRMNIISSQPPLNATSNSSFLLSDTTNGLIMTSCSDRSNFPLTRSGNTIQGTPVGTMQVNNNDTLSASSNYGDVDASKMATTQRFDMGILNIQGVGLSLIHI